MCLWISFPLPWQKPGKTGTAERCSACGCVIPPGEYVYVADGEKYCEECFEDRDGQQ